MTGDRLPLALLDCMGEEVIDFLQGQLSCDVLKMTPQQAQPFVYANSKGRVIANGWAVKCDDSHYLLIIDASVADTCCQHLQKYACLSDVTVEHDHRLQFMASDGESSAHHLLAVMATKPLQIEVFPHVVLHAAIDADALPQSAWSLLQWRQLLISQCWVMVNQALSAHFTPHGLSLHRWRTISYQKGCFIGQEVIARTHHLGKVKRSVYAVTLHSGQSLQPHDTIDFAANKQALVIDYLPETGMALLMLRHDDLAYLPDTIALIDTADPL